MCQKITNNNFTGEEKNQIKYILLGEWKDNFCHQQFTQRADYKSQCPINEMKTHVTRLKNGKKKGLTNICSL